MKNRSTSTSGNRRIWWRPRKKLNSVVVDETSDYRLFLSQSESSKDHQVFRMDDSFYELETSDMLGETDDGPFEWIILPEPTIRLFGEVNVIQLNEIESYQLWRYPGLHRKFAESASDQQSLLKFANQYGFLGTETTLVSLANGETVWAECMAQWLNEACNMRNLLRLWDALKSKQCSRETLDTLSLDTGFPEFHNNVLGGRESQYRLVYVPNGDSIELENLEAPKDIADVVKDALETLLRVEIERHISLDIIINQASQLRLETNTLLGHLYASFVEEILGRSEPLVRCNECNGWFTLEQKGTMYCSNACKMRAYRARKGNSHENKKK